MVLTVHQKLQNKRLVKIKMEIDMIQNETHRENYKMSYGVISSI